MRALRAAPRDSLPDAVFTLGMLSPPVALVAFGELRYRVLPLPYAEAFAQSRFMDLEQDERTSNEHPLAVQREFVYDAAIPAFVYQVEPAVPPRRIHTLGTRLLLVAHEGVDPNAVERLLERIFHTRIARVMHPPLTPELLSLPHELKLHRGTRDYLRRNEPLITGASADLVSNVVSIGGALIGGALFLGQWLHTRRRQRHHEIFDAYIRRVATIERRASEIELSAELTLAPLVELQRVAGPRARRGTRTLPLRGSRRSDAALGAARICELLSRGAGPLDLARTRRAGGALASLRLVASPVAWRVPRN